LNIKVKAVLIIGLLLIFLACVYVPWVVERHMEGKGLEYHSICWYPPPGERVKLEEIDPEWKQKSPGGKTAIVDFGDMPILKSGSVVSFSMDFKRLKLEVIAITVLTGVGVLVTWKRK
jgi:hypothetical protein